MFPTVRGATSSVPADLVAGLTLAAIALPGSMAAAQLAGVSPTLGLLAFSIGAVVFALVGGHRILSVGPDSTIAPMLAAGAAGGVGIGVTATDAAADPDPGAIMLISLMAGLILIVVGVIRGGWITQFLSRPVTVGLLAGIGISIIVSQLSTIFGIGQKTSGSVPVQLLQLWDLRGEINPWSAGLSLMVLAVSIGVGLISSRLPGALFGLAVAATAVAALDLGARGVDKLQTPDSVWRLPDFQGVPWASAWDLLPSALVIVVLITVQTGATEASSKQGQKTLDRDLAAIGVASVFSAAAGAFALNSSPPRTRLIQDARGKTQVVALAAGVLVLIILLFGTGLLALLPAAALAAVLVQIAFSLIRVKEMRRIAAYSLPELGIAVGTIVLVCTLGVVQGVAIAALVTLLDRTRREARPAVYRKGLIPQSNHWVPMDAGVETVHVQGILVWSVEAPIWYADANFVIEQLHEELDDGEYSVVVLDGTSISDLDYTGVVAMTILVDHLVDEGIPVLMARATRPTQKALKRAGLSEKMQLHPTVSDAVKAGAELAGLEAEFRAARGKKKDLAALEEEGLKRRELIDAPADPTDGEQS